jgi:hypothetical protein
VTAMAGGTARGWGVWGAGNGRISGAGKALHVPTVSNESRTVYTTYFRSFSQETIKGGLPNLIVGRGANNS